jgi:hypothetical protein
MAYLDAKPHFELYDIIDLLTGLINEPPNEVRHE